MMPKAKCWGCKNRIEIVYLHHGLSGSNKLYPVQYCRFGIPIREMEIRKCEAFEKRK